MLFKKNWPLQSALGRAFVTLTNVRFLVNKFQCPPSAQKVRVGQAVMRSPITLVVKLTEYSVVSSNRPLQVSHFMFLSP